MIALRIIPDVLPAPARTAVLALDAPAREAAAALGRGGPGAVVVVGGDGHAAGVVTGRQIAEAVASRAVVSAGDLLGVARDWAERTHAELRARLFGPAPGCRP